MLRCFLWSPEGARHLVMPAMVLRDGDRKSAVQGMMVTHPLLKVASLPVSERGLGASDLADPWALVKVPTLCL